MKMYVGVLHDIGDDGFSRREAKIDNSSYGIANVKQNIGLFFVEGYIANECGASSG